MEKVDVRKVVNIQDVKYNDIFIDCHSDNFILTGEVDRDGIYVEVVDGEWIDFNDGVVIRVSITTGQSSKTDKG